MQEKVEIITNHFETFWNYWTKILKNGYCAANDSSGATYLMTSHVSSALWTLPIHRGLYDLYYAKTFGQNEIQLYITTQGVRIIWRLLEFSPLSFDRISICDFSHHF